MRRCPAERAGFEDQRTQRLVTVAQWHMVMPVVGWLLFAMADHNDVFRLAVFTTLLPQRCAVMEAELAGLDSLHGQPGTALRQDAGKLGQGVEGAFDALACSACSIRATRSWRRWPSMLSMGRPMVVAAFGEK